MTLPVSSGTFISSSDYNDIYALVSEVIGPGDNGYGLNLIFSQPVSNQYTATKQQWENLRDDLNTAYIHITNTATATATISTTTTITASFINEMWEAANFITANRYTCHPTQFIDTVTNTTLYTVNGVSARTTSTAWGVPGSADETITHEVNVVWASRLTQRYFFNTGSELVWLPYHTGESLNPEVSLTSLDTAWANFINYIQAIGGWTYNRSTFEDWTTTATVYNSGTLKISILADKETERNIRFVCTLTNTDVPGVEVAPTTGYYNIIV